MEVRDAEQVSAGFAVQALKPSIPPQAECKGLFNAQRVAWATAHPQQRGLGGGVHDYGARTGHARERARGTH